MYVHEGKEVILAELNPQDSKDYLVLNTLTLGSIVKTFHGVQLDLVASPSSFRDQIACFVMHEKIGKDEQKLVVVDTLGGRNGSEKSREWKMQSGIAMATKSILPMVKISFRSTPAAVTRKDSPSPRAIGRIKPI